MSPFYTPDPRLPAERRRGRWLVAALAFFCLIYGIAFAVMAPFLMVAFVAPPVLLGMLAIWALPEMRAAPVRHLGVLLFAFIAGLVGWPNYLALALPGMPWITVARLTGIPLIFLFLTCISVSSSFRSTLKNLLKETPYIWKSLLVFVAVQAVTVGFSKNPVYSANNFIVDQMNWTAMFFISAYVFLKPGRIEWTARLLWILALLVCFIGLLEFKHSRVPWGGHIPSFLKIEDPAVLLALAGQRRAADGIYRVQSTFSTPLGMSEYLALAMPFLLQFVAGAYRMWVRLCAIATIPLVMFLVLISGSRLGFIGCLMSFTLYLLLWALLAWRRNRESFIAPAIALAYPAIFAVAVASTFFVHAIRARVWGDGVQQFSDAARQQQWAMGVPKILSHPWGHGPGTSGDVLGYVTEEGFQTIDSYYLSIGLDFGVLGFLLYYGIIVAGITYSSKAAIATGSGERDFAFFGPLAIALANFLVIKSVFSQQDNHPLIFIMLGMIAAMVHRAKAGDTGADNAVNPPRLPRKQRGRR